MSLCTIEQIYEYKQSTYDPSDTSQTLLNSLYDSLILSVSEYIETYCNRTFAETTYTGEKYDGEGTTCLLLNNYPIISITSIEEGTDRDVSTWTTIDLNDCEIMYPEGEIYYGGGFSTGKRNIKITYTAGYTILPYSLTTLCVQMILDIVDKSKRDGMLNSETIGDYSYTISSIVDKNTEYQNVLSFYKNDKL